MALQDSLSSSSCGSLAPSQGSLEHGPEDGALYDLLHDPAYYQRGRRSNKVEFSSLLVVSGGLGHRRVSKKTKQSRHEDNNSTIMIWQIPLLNMWCKHPNDISLDNWKLHKIFLILSFCALFFHVKPNCLHGVLTWWSANISPSILSIGMTKWSVLYWNIVFFCITRMFQPRKQVIRETTLS